MSNSKQKATAITLESERVVGVNELEKMLSIDIGAVLHNPNAYRRRAKPKGSNALKVFRSAFLKVAAE